MSARIARHVRSNVVGYVAVFLALSGTAMALPGTNTVFSDDITNGQVKTPDLNGGAVTTGKLAPNSVESPKILDEGVKTLDIADNHVRSSDVRNDNLVGGGLAAIDLSLDSVGSSEIAANAVGDSEIEAGGVGASEIASGSVQTSELANGAVTITKLNAVTGVATVNFPSIAAGDCDTRTVVATGVTTTDNLVVTADHTFTSFLSWNARQGTIDNVFFVSACNPTDSPINEEATAFRYLAIHP
jgi:hypothetical protein